jgi:hypothetical protein
LLHHHWPLVFSDNPRVKTASSDFLVGQTDAIDIDNRVVLIHRLYLQSPLSGAEKPGCFNKANIPPSEPAPLTSFS